MVDSIKNQIRTFERIIKPYLYEGRFSSQWSLIEQKTHLKRDQIALGGLLAVFVLYLAFGWGNDFLCNLIGFLYPAYASLLALESSTAGYDTPWLVYWVIYAFFGFIEYIGNNFFQTLLFYWLGKSVFLLWLMAPGSANGSNMLYKQLIRPLVLKYSPPVSKPVPESGSYATEYHSYASNN